MKAALRKKSNVTVPKSRSNSLVVEERSRRRSSTLTPDHARLEVPKITKQFTVDVPLKQRSRTPSPIPPTILEEGEPAVRRVARFRKSNAIDRSRSPSPNPQSNGERNHSTQINSQPTATTTTTTSTENNNVTTPAESPSSETPPEVDPAAKAKKSAEKLKYIINELIQTEEGYVKDLRILTTKFLVPLKRAALIPDDEIDAITKTIKDISAFQDVLLQSMEDAKNLNPDFDSLEDPNDFKRILMALGSAFLFHRGTFNLYSKFCAVHSRAQKLINQPSKKDQMMKSFLESRLSSDQDTPTLGISSYLIKPMQRILKYPLLLRELQNRFDSESEIHYHLNMALKEMQTVANHINDMMRVHEQYGNVFETLLAPTAPLKGTKKSKAMVTELPMDDLVMHSTATWLNADKDLGKAKRLTRGPEITVLVFKKAVVLICKEKIRTRRLSLVGMMAAAQAADDDGCSFKTLIPISNVQAKEITDNEDTEGDYHQWELIHNTVTDLEENKKSFHLECSSAALRSEFVKTIRKMISERNRIQILRDAGKSSHVLRKISDFRCRDSSSGAPRLERGGLRRVASECATNNGTEPPDSRNPQLKKRENTF